jgi:hypothetical protein
MRKDCAGVGEYEKARWRRPPRKCGADQREREGKKDDSSSQGISNIIVKKMMYGMWDGNRRGPRQIEQREASQPLSLSGRRE